MGADAAKALKDYMEALTCIRKNHMSSPPGFKYACMEDFVLQEGREFTPAPLPDDIPRGVIKECYKNSFDILFEKPDLTYCEGYAHGAVIPVMHAWLATSDGKVVDATWPEIGSAYWGIPFERDFVMKTAMTREVYGVIDNWEENYPLLREGVEGAAKLLRD